MSYQKNKENIQEFLIIKIKELKLSGIANAEQEIKWLLIFFCNSCDGFS